ncbi:MAG: inositol monophosphatase family protein [Tepidisphaeraceae bacterium]
MSISDDLEFAAELARGAGKIVLQHYGKSQRLTKTHAAATAEAVTEADRAAQRYIVSHLRTRFPGDGIIGEESDSGESITLDVRDPRGRNWVIDPIDGTNNFIAGLGIFAVCIGLLDGGFPVLGVVYDVTRDAMYTAARGLGARLGGQRLKAAATPGGENTIVMLTSNLLKNDGTCPKWAVRWIAQTDIKTRILGSAAVETVMVASGVAHGAVTINGKLWDLVAPAAIVLEAGGVVTDLKGAPIFPFDLTRYAGERVPFLAAGKAAHEALIREVVENP